MTRWQYRHELLGLCMLAFFVTFFARLAVSPVVPLIKDDFSVTNTQIGLGLAGMWLAYGLTQYPSGILGDRYGERRIVLVAVGGTTVFSLLLAVAPVFAVFVVCLVMLGSVAGLHYTVGTTYLSRTWDNMGFAVGIHSLGAPLAGLTAPVATAWVGVQYGWRPALVLTALVGGPIFALFFFRTRPTPPRRPERDMRSKFQLQPLLATISQKRVAFTLLIAIVATFVLQGLISFLPTFLAAHQEQSTTLAGVFFAAYFLIRGGVQIGVGSLSDRIGPDFALSCCMLAGALGTFSILVEGSLLFVVVGIFLMGIGASFFPALDPRFLEHLSDAERGTEFGLVRTVYGVLGGAGSVTVGVLADLFGWPASFAVLGALYFVAFCALFCNWVFDLRY